MSLHNEFSETEIKLSQPEKPLGIFEAYGIEIEYMLVNRSTLEIVPAADKVFDSYGIPGLSDIHREDITISNELVRHVVEFKSTNPVKNFNHFEESLIREISRFNTLAGEEGWMLMPGGMHPWMDPDKEIQLWPGGEKDIYETYNRIFNCKGHGWSNLQSTHLNLPFHGDAEFSRLMAAIRVILPIIPALAASSPVADGQRTNFADYRLEVYRHNQEKVPSICGEVIPEPVYNISDYKEEILDKMYRDIQPFDPEGILQDEWLNSRGAIVRFDRSAIEIRLIDSQESPKADLAVVSLITGAIRQMAEGRLSGPDEQRLADQKMLVAVLDNCIKNGRHAVIEDHSFFRLFGMPGKKYKAGEIWQNIFERHMLSEEESDRRKSIEIILRNGTLSERILKALGEQIDRQSLKEVYARLCDCLNNNNIFIP